MSKTNGIKMVSCPAPEKRSWLNRITEDMKKIEQGQCMELTDPKVARCLYQWLRYQGMVPVRRTTKDGSIRIWRTL